ncbi:MAG: sigma-70 family RNA polymerase sigma factor [Flavobacteriales bacterium]|nr:sigma-70 family RNA polymerase sigma factor [Flavobacteriales bacterium]
MHKTNDEEIIRIFREEGNGSRSFALLIDAYQKPIYYFIRKMVLDHDDAADISQNTFIKAWKAFGSFRGESKISSWLYRIAYNESITFINKEKRLGKVRLEDVEEFLSKSLEADVHYNGDEIQKKLQTAMALLPEKQKAVFIMKYFEEKKYVEISEITGTSVGALKASFHLAVKKIEDYLTSH